jgi:hypothetical protein
VALRRAGLGAQSRRRLSDPLMPRHDARLTQRARFMGRARGDTIREQAHALVAQMREGGAEVSDLAAMVENFDSGNSHLAEPG